MLGLRTKLESGKTRHEFQTDHGFRKWFKTRCELAGMKPINIEKLMNHSVGISDSYYRATENDLLEDYLKAVDFLTSLDKWNGIDIHVNLVYMLTIINNSSTNIFVFPLGICY